VNLCLRTLSPCSRSCWYQELLPCTRWYLDVSISSQLQSL
jgi:hypothetical protein